MGGNAASIRVKRNAQKALVGNPGVRDPLGRPSCRRENNITIYLGGLEWERLEWTHLA
jgi:hypothetical protein